MTDYRQHRNIRLGQTCRANQYLRRGLSCHLGYLIAVSTHNDAQFMFRRLGLVDGSDHKRFIGEQPEILARQTG